MSMRGACCLCLVTELFARCSRRTPDTTPDLNHPNIHRAVSALTRYETGQLGLAVKRRFPGTDVSIECPEKVLAWEADKITVICHNVADAAVRQEVKDWLTRYKEAEKIQIPIHLEFRRQVPKEGVAVHIVVDAEFEI